jgi:type IV pilus assembly protein PilA
MIKDCRKSFTLFPSQGFTLAELLTVVAIIGILSAVATPSFRKYQAKSRITEAKMSLAAAYTAETDTYNSYATYAGCLGALGITLAPAANRYYGIGFGTLTTGLDGSAAWGSQYLRTVIGLTTCVDTTTWGTDIYFISPGKTISGGTLTTHDDLQTPNLSSLLVVTQSTYQVGAAAILRAGNTADVWIIEETKKFTHLKTGY